MSKVFWLYLGQNSSFFERFFAKMLKIEGSTKPAHFIGISNNFLMSCAWDIRQRATSLQSWLNILPASTTLKILYYQTCRASDGLSNPLCHHIVQFGFLEQWWTKECWVSFGVDEKTKAKFFKKLKRSLVWSDSTFREESIYGLGVELRPCFSVVKWQKPLMKTLKTDVFSGFLAF